MYSLTPHSFIHHSAHFQTLLITCLSSQFLIKSYPNRHRPASQQCQRVEPHRSGLRRPGCISQACYQLLADYPYVCDANRHAMGSLETPGNEMLRSTFTARVTILQYRDGIFISVRTRTRRTHTQQTQRRGICVTQNTV